MFLAARTRFDDPLAAASSIRAELKALDPELPIPRMESWTGLLERTLSTRRFSLVLLTIFAAAGLLLAAVGTYGMLAFSISQRMKEYGIRMALGAAPGDIVRNALACGIAPAVIGLAAGLAVTLVSTRVLKGLLFETAPNDPLTLGCMVLLLLSAAFAASAVPVRRALRVNPSAALRHD
jgi:ABC-type antimicrobial peptide transport system permease subunit